MSNARSMSTTAVVTIALMLGGVETSAQAQSTAPAPAQAKPSQSQCIYKFAQNGTVVTWYANEGEKATRGGHTIVCKDGKIVPAS